MISPTYIAKEQRWKYRYTYWVDGTRKEKVFSSSKKGEAGKREVVAKFRAWRGNSFESVWECYIQDRTHRLGEDSPTLKNEVSIGRNHLLPAFSNRSIDSLKIADYQTYINQLTLQNGKKPSSKYLRDIIGVLSAYLRWAWEQEYLFEPLRGKLYLPKGLTTTGKAIPTLEQFKLMCQPTNLHYQPLILFLCTTGMRPSEAIGLKKTDIVAGVASIRRGILKDGQISEGKTKNARRTVALCRLAQKQVDVMCERFPNSEWVFCSTTGDVVKQKNITKQLKSLCKKCGIEPLSLYSCRHFFITYTTNELGLEAAKHQVGHSSSMDTIATYTQSTEAEQTAVRGALDIIFEIE